jgi:hypothetical protein
MYFLSILYSIDQWVNIKFLLSNKGSKAGLPYASLLILLVEEGLSRMVYATKIKGIKMGNHLSLSHILSVKNVRLFSVGIVREGGKYKDIIDLYSKASRMEVNVHKSFIVFNGLDEGL